MHVVHVHDRMFTSPPYGCTTESASTVAASVTGGAGAGKLRPPRGTH
ncbi:hypothetical protein KJK32_06245 [Streptomyces sp. JCM17656]|nr:hypothetical protein KJK32_06245 [Streptomyces sp. JCM17656]